MADKIPAFALSPREAAEWVRWAQDKIVSLLGDSERKALDQNATDRGLSASVGSLSDQIRDLQGRVAYSLDGYDFQSWTATQADDYAFGDSLTFTLTEQRRVSIQFAVDVSATATISTTTSSATAFIHAGVLVNGSPVTSQTQNGVTATVSGAAGRATAQSASTSSTAIARVLVDLPEGTHVIRGALRTRRVNLSGTAAGLINVAGYQLFVDVLQPAGA